MTDFRTAVEAGDIEAATDCLADNVRFTSPVAFKPYDGKPITAAILRAVFSVFEDFHYVREVGSADGRDHVLEFEATVDGKAINGVDMLHLDEAGKIDDFKVMVRPYSAAGALSAAMGARFEQIVAEASKG